MNLYEIEIAPCAIAHMQEIVNYISETLCAPDAARQLLTALKAAMDSCARFPARHPLLTHEPEHSLGYRKIIVNNYYAYYLIDEEAHRVIFTAVIYAGRNQTVALLRSIDID